MSSNPPFGGDDESLCHGGRRRGRRDADSHRIIIPSQSGEECDLLHLRPRVKHFPGLSEKYVLDYRAQVFWVLQDVAIVVAIAFP